jgi:N-acetylglucosamine-6-phosphate deacetylase
MKYALVGARIFTGDEFLDAHAVVIDGEQISAVCSINDLAVEIPKVNLKGGLLAPGFIDVQINGAGGAFFTQTPTLDTLKRMSSALLPLGTTSFLPTVISAPADVYQKAQHAVNAAMDDGLNSVLGIHIEGPFFTPSKRGCHPASAIRACDPADLQQLTAPHQGVRLITLAPDIVSPEVIRQIVNAGNIVALGHSDASYEAAIAACDAGASGFTHLYNAMRNATGREPGMVGAALDRADTWCGIIADGHHVHFASVRIALAAKGAGNVIFVSDAMSPLGSDNKSFTLDGEEITERNGRLINADGRLAGSAISLIDAVRVGHQHIGISLDECLRMASLYPAAILGKSSALGRIAPHYFADLVLISDDLAVRETYKRGLAVIERV